MPTIVQTIQSRVTGLWGSALIRGANGKLRPLKMGEVVVKGDVILTTQDGIVQLSLDRDAPVLARTESSEVDRVMARTELNEVDRVISALNAGDPEAATAAGLNGGAGDEFMPGLRVDRVVEDVTPAGLQLTLIDRSVRVTVAGSTVAPENQVVPATGAVNSTVSAVEEGAPVNLGLTAPLGVPPNAAVSIGQLPVIGQIQKADGTVVTASSVLTAADLAGLRYVPPGDYDGSAVVGNFTYTVSNGGVSSTGTASINVAPVNDAPRAASAAVSGQEDATLPVSLTGQDVDGTLAGVTIVSLPPGSSLLLADGVTPVLAGQTLTAAQAASLLFRPSADQSGNVGIVFTVTDNGGAVSAPATVAFNIIAVNDVPVSTPDVASTLEDSPVSGNLLNNDTDVDGPTLSVTGFSVLGTSHAPGSTVNLPGIGSLVVAADGSYTFTPAPNYNGSVPTVGYTVSDGSLTSASTLTLSVTTVNDAPVAVADLASTPVNTPVTLAVLANDSDPDGDALSVTGAVLSTPSQGSVTVNPDGTLSFTPASNVTGLVVITYTVSDLNGGTRTATVTVNVDPNTPPAGADNSRTLSEDGSVVVNLADFGFSDIDAGQSLANVRIDTLPAAGTLLLNGVSVLAGALISAADVAAGKLMFVPLANGNGAPYATFSFSVQDNGGAFDTTPNTLRFDVTPVNDAPLALPDSATTPEDTPVSGNLLSNDSDIDGDTLSVTQFVVNGITFAAGTLSTLPGVGSLLVNPDGSYTFTPLANYSGAVPVVTYTVSEGAVTSTATLTLSIMAVNDAPVAAPDVRTLLEDTPAVGNVLGNDVDVDGSALTLTQFSVAGVPGSFTAGQTASIPGVGSLLMLADGNYSFTPAPNYAGAVPLISYTATDGALISSSTLSLSITPVNDAPVAADDLASTAINAPISIAVLANDRDPDGDTLIVSNPVLGNPLQGSVSVDANGALVFTPAANFSGPVSITYTVTDPSGLTDTATVTVNVGTNNPPTGADHLATLAEDSTYIVQTSDFGFADVDLGQTLVNVRIDSLPAGGALLLNGNPVPLGAVVSAADVAAGLLVFVPAANANGAPYASFSFSVQDSGGAFDAVPNTVSFDVTPVNDVPVAVADTVNAIEDQPFSGTLAGNDQLSGDGGNVFALVAGRGPSSGSIVFNPDGTFTYTPTANFTGVDSFSYTLTDADGDVSTAVASVNVASVNDVPTAVIDTIAAVEDTPFVGSVAGNDSLSGDGGNVFARVAASGPAHGGILFNANGTFIYTPDANYNGPDSFSYSISDANGDVSTALVSIGVASVNDVPTAVADSVAAVEDTPFVGSVAGNDQLSGDGGNVFALVPASGPANGGIVFNGNGTFTYTPNANFNGPDSFSYSITDANGDVSTALVSIGVASVNDVPTAVADFVAAVEDTPFVGSVAGNDTLSGDGGNVFSLVGGSGPTHGGIVFNADGTFTYTPSANYNGPDAFSYSITDANGDVSTALVSVGVASVNDVPTAVADSVAATEDTPFVGSVAGNDTLSGDGGNVFSLVGDSGPTHGGIVFNTNGTFTYTPSANYNGPDAFSYAITDANGDVSTALVTIGVAAVNDVPTAVADSVAAVEDTPFVGSVAGNDMLSGDGGNVFSLVGGSGPTHGGIVFNSDGTFTYTPSANYNGADSFSYSLTDANGDVSTALVTVGVASVNDVPTAVADSVAAVEDTPFVGSVAANDTLSGDGGNVFSLVGGSGPTHGGIVFTADGTFTYTPSANYNGPDSFSYSITDANGDVSTALVTIGVASVNDVPTAVADSVAAVEDTPFVGSVANNDTLSGDGGNVFSLVGGSGPTHGGIVFNADGTFTYTPSANYNGADSFSYSLTDANGDVSSAVVTIGVASVNDVPTAVADTIAATEDTPFVGSVGGNDTLSGDGGNVFALVPASGPSNGGIVFSNNGTFTYTPNANFNGSDSFSYSITDANGDVSTARVSIGVSAVNDAPVAVADTASATEAGGVANGSLGVNPSGNVLSNDTDVDMPDTKTVSAVSGAAAGTVGASTAGAFGALVLNADGSYIYTVNNTSAAVQALRTAANTLTDTFSYTLRDAAGLTSSTTLTVTIAGSNDAPVATVDTGAATEDVTLNVSAAAGVLANDTDVDAADTKTVSAVSFGATPGSVGAALLGTYGSLTLKADGSYSYTANRPAAQALAAGATASEVFTCTVRDAAGATSTTSLTLTITGTNDAPVAVADTGSTAEDTPLSTTAASGLLANDSDVDAGSTLAITQFTVAGVGGTFTAGSTATIAGVGTLLINANGSYTFTPQANYSGAVPAATYTVSDGAGGTATATLSINVTAVADAPTLSVGSAKPALVFANSWEATVSSNTTSEAVATNPFEGWTRVDTPNRLAGGTNTIEVWTTGDTQTRQDNSTNIVVASAGNGEDFVELNNASGNFQTLGLTRSVATQAGMVYDLSLDYAGRSGFTADFTRIGVYLDGVLIRQFAATSPQTSIDWHNLHFSFVGNGAARNLTIQTDATAFDANGRGAFIDDLRLTSYQGVVAGNAGAGATTSIGLAGYVSAALTDIDGSESLTLSFSGVPAGALIVTTGNPAGYAAVGGTIMIAGSELASAQLQFASSVTGHLSLGVTATSTEASNGAAASTRAPLELSVIPVFSSTDLAGDALTSVLGTAANNTLSGGNADELLVGLDGNDVINSADGADYLDGGNGTDTLNGGNGNDVLYGGAGSDSLTGGAGADVFRWTLLDRGVPGTPPTDTITDFINTPTGDSIDLRDLLVGEHAGNLTSYLHFTTTGTDTTVSISSTGGFSGGFSTAAVDQVIQLTTVNLLTGFANDAAIIADLLARGKLVTDNV